MSHANFSLDRATTHNTIRFLQSNYLNKSEHTSGFKFKAIHATVCANRHECYRQKLTLSQRALAHIIQAGETRNAQILCFPLYKYRKSYQECANALVGANRRGCYHKKLLLPRMVVSTLDVPTSSTSAPLTASSARWDRS